MSMRKDIGDAHRRAWQRLAQPGTWLNGAERVADATGTPLEDYKVEAIAGMRADLGLDDFVHDTD
jgi:hypothetical protein